MSNQDTTPVVNRMFSQYGGSTSSRPLPSSASRHLSGASHPAQSGPGLGVQDRRRQSARIQARQELQRTEDASRQSLEAREAFLAAQVAPVQPVPQLYVQPHGWALSSPFMNQFGILTDAQLRSFIARDRSAAQRLPESGSVEATLQHPESCGDEGDDSAAAAPAEAPVAVPVRGGRRYACAVVYTRIGGHVPSIQHVGRRQEWRHS
jgi:hypothetical protein